MGKRNGGKRHDSKQENDIYFNRVNACEITKYLSPHFSHLNKPNILDACSGDGVLGDSLSFLFQEFCLINQDIKHNGVSILQFNPLCKFDIIISNPPWVPVTLPLQIYNHLITLLSDHGVLIFIINNTFCYQGIDRACNLSFHKYYFLPRFTFLSAEKKLLDPGVMIFHNDNNMPIKASLLRPFIPLTKVRKCDLQQLEFKI